MSVIRQYNFEVVVNDTFSGLQVTVTEDGTTPVDISTASLKMSIRKNKAVGQLVKNANISIVDGPNGIYRVEPFDFNYPAGKYYYDIQMILDGVKKTYLGGKITAIDSVTDG